jgi:hypothetical protein
VLRVGSEPTSDDAPWGDAIVRQELVERMEPGFDNECEWAMNPQKNVSREKIL